jgi:hypothetical protein
MARFPKGPCADLLPRYTLKGNLLSRRIQVRKEKKSMKQMIILLRMTVFAVALVLLTDGPPAMSSTVYTCVSYTTTQQSCPSGCTNSTFVTAIPNGPGEYNLVTVSQPCGTNKPGQTCSQPSGVLQAQLGDCCVTSGGYCGNPGSYCCPGLACGNTFGQPICCLPVDSACESDDECCTNICNTGTHLCTNIRP